METMARTSTANWTVLLFGGPASRREPALLGRLRFRGVGLAQLERDLPFVVREELGWELAAQVRGLSFERTGVGGEVH
ncbi:MAG: hypothetical protein F9K16_01790 [Thermoanaerobaculia bacterium]|nr:MAG: hypothetical protein F9K16_01790 [Thermoanaerobaculia bacterium]MBZ0102672.1 hypothetical protein [Thermoanaerobaculia bacterium]